MKNETTDILKSSGEKVKFSIEKLRGSLRHSGADETLINQIVDTVRDELYQGDLPSGIYYFKKKEIHIRLKIQTEKSHL